MDTPELEADHGPQSFDEEDLTYNRYLKVDELLSLQKLRSRPGHHDEMLFIIIHQAYELWFKQIILELESTLEAMEQQRVLRAHHFMDRAVKIMQLLVKQIHLLETMAPAEFLQFRDRLNPASGFQSIQFREIEFLGGLKDKQFPRVFQNWPEYVERLQRRYAGPDLRTAYYQLLLRQGYAVPESLESLREEPSEEDRQALLAALLSIYQNPEDYLPLYLLSESLVDFDEALMLWRKHHVLTVERVIGMRQGTGGSTGVRYLESTTSKRCFPLLWEVRTHLVKRQL